jgi:hypothetical protein
LPTPMAAAPEPIAARPAPMCASEPSIVVSPYDWKLSFRAQCG